MHQLKQENAIRCNNGDDQLHFENFNIFGRLYIT